MRVLYHADINHNQAAVVWRCRDDLAALYGIDLVHEPSVDDARRNVQRGDTLLVHSPQLDAGLLVGELPVVILERIDGGQLSSGVRRALAFENVRAVIKNAIYADWTKYNRAPFRGHEWACRMAMGEVTGPEPMRQERQWITPEQYAKLRIGFSFAAYPNLDDLRDAPAPDNDRPYLLHFAGTVDYDDDVQWLRWHRAKAVQAIQATPGDNICLPGRPLERPAYLDLLRRSRFCVSPWGLGEPCWRDFEAILCGCTVIKPDTSYVLTSPPDLYKQPAFIKCRPDFSDLCGLDFESKIAADVLRKTIIEESSTPRVAQRLANIFWEAHNAQVRDQLQRHEHSVPVRSGAPN